MTLLQSVGGYSQVLAQLVGGLMIVGVILYWYVTRRAGREGSEWDHESHIDSELGKIPKTPVAIADAETEFETMMSDVDYLTEVTDLGGVRSRIGNWFRRVRASGVYVHACPITDANGNTIHVASVNGHKLAHRDRHELLEDIETVATACLKGEQPPATFSEYYFRDITDGFVDIESTYSRVRGDCKTRIQENMQREGELPKEELIHTFVYESGFRYPKRVVEEKLAELISRDIRQHKDGRLEWQRF